MSDIKIQLTPNWLLISVDREIDRAVVSGITVDTTWEKETHAIVTGTVLKTSELRYIKPGYRDNRVLRNGGEAPLEFDTDMEVREGDFAYFNYLSMNNALKTGRVVELGGRMCAFIRYDRLYAVERDGVFIPVNGYVLATREPEVRSSLLTIPNLRNKNEATVDFVGTPLKEYFWERMQSAVPYYDHGFLQPGDIIIFREQAGRQLENKVVRARDIDYMRLQEKDVFARIRDGVLTPNLGITEVERMENDLSDLLIGTGDYNSTAKGRVLSSLHCDGEVYYKKGNEREVEIRGEDRVFVVDAYEVTEVNGVQILH